MPDIPPALAALSTVLDEYWDWLLSMPEWAGVTREELRHRYRGSAQYDGPDYERLMQRLDHAVTVVVEEARDTGLLTPTATALLLEAVLVDELWQDVLDQCTSTLRAPLRADLLRAGFTHWAEPVRLLCAEYTGKFPYSGAEELLDAAVAHADPIIVRRYALLALTKLAPARAVVWAAGFLSPLHPDEYLVLASIDILAAHAPAELSPLAPALRQHPSEYVRLRVSTGGFPAGPYPLH